MTNKVAEMVNSESIFNSEVGVDEGEFFEISRRPENYVNHFPSVFIKTDESGKLLGFALSIHDTHRGELVYLTTHASRLALFKSLDNVNAFMATNGVANFVVSTSV